MSLFKVVNLQKNYGKGGNQFKAIKNVSLEIVQGESVAITGKSGSGKSTLMHLLAGLDTPTSGEIIFLDNSLSKLSNDRLNKIRATEFGFIFQQFFMQKNLTVLENVCLPLKISNPNNYNIRQRAFEVLKSVNLEDKIRSKPNQLSGGQQQRVCIARALINNPKVIFADEPVGNLDSENSEAVTNLLFELQKKQGITLIIVTHDPDLARKCSRQVVIKDGEIV
jgi:putative ABC transport system ATP-binding protein